MCDQLGDLAGLVVRYGPLASAVNKASVGTYKNASAAADAKDPLAEANKASNEAISKLEGHTKDWEDSMNKSLSTLYKMARNNTTWHGDLEDKIKAFKYARL